MLTEVPHILGFSALYTDSTTKSLSSLYQIGQLSYKLLHKLKHNILKKNLYYGLYAQIKPRGTPHIDITEVIKELIVVVKFQSLILQAKTEQSKMV